MKSPRTPPGKLPAFLQTLAQERAVDSSLAGVEAALAELLPDPASVSIRIVNREQLSDERFAARPTENGRYVVVSGEAGSSLSLITEIIPLSGAHLSSPTLTLVNYLQPLMAAILLAPETISGDAIRRSFMEAGMSQLRSEIGLTQRQEEILAFLLSGYSHKMVAERLEISIETVRKHTKQMYVKAGVHSLGEFIARYFLTDLEIPTE